MRQHFFWNSLQDQAGQVTSCNVLHVLASSQFHFYYILASSDSTSTNHLYLDPRVRICLRRDKLVKDIITALTVKNPLPLLFTGERRGVPLPARCTVLKDRITNCFCLLLRIYQEDSKTAKWIQKNRGISYNLLEVQLQRINISSFLYY